MWQPGVVALMYLFGQVCTFLAFHWGDVSVAAPIFSVKVLMVAVFLMSIGGQTLSSPVWLAALAATAGVALIQRSGGDSRHGSLAASVVFALLAATNFALFDVLVQRWAPAWGVGRFLPLVFGMAGVLSLGCAPVGRTGGVSPGSRVSTVVAGRFVGCAPVVVHRADRRALRRCGTCEHRLCIARYLGRDPCMVVRPLAGWRRDARARLRS